MLFNSLQFAIFFPVVTILYFTLPHRGRVPLLLLASCYFYMAFVPKYVLILFALILVDYTAGILLENAPASRRKTILVTSLCANVGMLAFFKYYNFLNVNLAAASELAGWHYAVPALKLVLPIGLSFHTFQSMSYTIEVYRGNFKAERSLLHFATYVMFYPQLVAGPIERPQNLLHQFWDRHHFDWARFSEGMQLMATGLFKKVVIADRAAVLVNAVYGAPASFSGAQLLIATWFFAVQIYCDFAGYSEIARGTAKVMGFELMVNFNRPYLATSIADFWRRWHISLSTWFRDYMYFPLGGNRHGLARTCFALTVVFLVSGLWHGANWTFVIWGAIHAGFMVMYVLTNSLRRQLSTVVGGRSVMGAMGWLLTINVVGVAWVFFRAANVPDAMLVLGRIATDFLPRGDVDLHPGLDSVQFALTIGLIAALFATEVIGARTQILAALAERPRWQRWSAYYAFAILFVVLVLWSPERTPQPFIYFQF